MGGGTVCVALCSVKGGTGKTTLSFNLAERAGAYGLRTALVDCDVQEAGIVIHRMGGEERLWPVYRGAVSHHWLERVEGFREEGEYDFVVFDLPGYENTFLPRFLSEMDMVLSPVGLGPSDLVSARGFLHLLQRTEVNLVFVANGVSAGRGRLGELREVLEEKDGRVCPVVVRRRVAHMDALRLGLGVCEYDGRSAAAAEVDLLWRWVAVELLGEGCAGKLEALKAAGEGRREVKL